MLPTAISRKQRSAPSSLRQAVEFAVCLVITVLMSRSWFIESFVVPSSSMADSLLGVHRETRCRDCGLEFVCGSDDLTSETLRAVCVNCGCADNDLTDNPDINGDRLVVFKSAYTVRQPRRWEVIVFRYPEVAQKAFIKRVVGLPGELVQVIDGEVYVNGEMVRKSLEAQRALAVLVHDSSATSSYLPPRWMVDSDATGWRFGGGRFVRTPLEASSIDWLTYRHWRRMPTDSTGIEEVPIRDEYSYNQSRVRKVEDSKVVTDIFVSAQLRSRGEGRLSFFLSDGREQLLLHLAPHTGQVDLLHNGRVIASEVAQHPLLVNETYVELSIVDRQFLVAFDGQLVLAPYPYEPSDLPQQPTSRPAAIGATGLQVEVSELRLYRDVYYTSPPEPYGQWALAEPYRLANDEYFVLGDNSPLSDDSRSWPHGPAVQSKLLIGKPMMVHLPSRLLWWREQPFQVPDVAHMRTIQ